MHPTPTADAAARLSIATLALAASFGCPLAAQADDEVAKRVAAQTAAIEETYLIGPAAAQKLGCRVAWQTYIPLPDKISLSMVSASPEGILALNSRNEVTLVRPETGNRAWTTSAAESSDNVLALDIVSTEDGAKTPRITVASDSTVYALDFDSGAGVARQRYRFVPANAPIFLGESVVYGARAGQVVWLNSSTGSSYKAHTVDPAARKASAVNAQPAYSKGMVVAASSTGTVAALDSATGSLIWMRELLGGVSAKPAIAGDLVFVASEDQYFYAFDLSSGETEWKYFTQSPLTAAPFAANGLVFQDIPGEGLVAFTQMTEGKIGGDVRWKKTGLTGKPVTTMGNALVMWCNAQRRATFVDMANGEVLSTLDLPQVTRLMADALEPGGFVAYSVDGRIERLSPIAPR